MDGCMDRWLDGGTDKGSMYANLLLQKVDG